MDPEELKRLLAEQAKANNSTILDSVKDALKSSKEETKKEVAAVIDEKINGVYCRCHYML